MAWTSLEVEEYLLGTIDHMLQNQKTMDIIILNTKNSLIKNAVNLNIKISLDIFTKLQVMEYVNMIFFKKELSIIGKEGNP